MVKKSKRYKWMALMVLMAPLPNDSALVWKYYPQVFAVLSGMVCWSVDGALENHQVALLSATITFGAIAAGFVGVSLAILAGTTIRCYVDPAQLCVGWGFTSGILLACVGMTGLLFDLKNPLFAGIWCASLIFCLACLHRLGGMMLYLFKDSKSGI